MPDSATFDLLVIGGGINGAGIARDAAGRGLDVALCEQGDLGNYTSSASTKLIHGGLRYLEYYEFGLVRKALREREVLLGIAPHIIWPMQFVMPHVKALRPAWMIRAGLFLYDHLGGFGSLPGSHGIALHGHAAGKPLQRNLKKGFVYSDCWVQDARLVVLNAMDAAERGATVWPRTRCVAAERRADDWVVTLRSTVDGSERTVHAKAIANAAGPWVAGLLDDAGGFASRHTVHLVKGSHIIVPRLFDHGYAYLFQNTDRRVIFAIPYERDFTLIGTTDVPYTGNPAEARTSPDEIAYLCDAVNRYFADPIGPDDVVSTYAGVRPLHDESGSGNASAISRDYSLDLDTRQAPVLTVLGGKLTTYRKLAVEALERLSPLLGHERPEWTGSASLPGGDLPATGFQGLLAALRDRYPWLPDGMAWRLARNYGTRTDEILRDAESLDGLGRHFGADLYEAEVRYLMDHEWAMTAEDVLWRRSKLGLRLTAAERADVEAWMTDGVVQPVSGAASR
ncbi:MAG: glycerol-3-phosphate dehydrogenase [Halofilum sp. (in: g-proteobacteria)]